MTTDPLVCERCGVSIRAEGCCIDGVFLCLPCWREGRPIQGALDFPTGVTA